MNATVLNSLMDVAGAPAHPLVFLVLGVVTFALHIAAVSLMLGTLGLSAWGAFSRSPYAGRLSHTLMMTAKVSVAFAVVLGVAPLLFVQVIYDSYWYVSNVLSAWWLMIFVVILIAAYLGLYRAYGLNHTYLEDGTPVPVHGEVRGGMWLVASLVLLLGCGAIMHVLANQALFPERWMSWYAPGGVVNPDGRSLHYALLPRLIFFLSLSLPVTAGWLFALRRYLINGGETDTGYLGYIESMAHRFALAGAVLVAVSGAAWMMMLPESMVWFRQSVWVGIGLIPLIFFFVMSPVQKKRRLCIPCGYLAFVMSLVMVIILAALREVMRYGTLLSAYGWNALDYKVNMDWPTTIIFFTTFVVVGGLNITYLTLLAFKSGHEKGVYTPGPALNRLGQACVVSLVAWVVAYFAIGLSVVS